MRHTLKCWPEFFGEIVEGRKRHDLRRNTVRTFSVGDSIVLREFNPRSQKYTGREIEVVTTYITSADHPCALSENGLSPGFCILSIEVPA